MLRIFTAILLSLATTVAVNAQDVVKNVTYATSIPQTWILVTGFEKSRIIGHDGQTLGEVVGILVNNHVMQAYVISLADKEGKENKKIALTIDAFTPEPKTYLYFGEKISAPTLHWSSTREQLQNIPEFNSSVEKVINRQYQ